MTTETTADTWDAIVIGSGPGGLTTAACLGSAGNKVLVLEAHDLAGGNTQVFRRHHGPDWYEFDVGVHYIGECGPGGLFTTVFNSLGVGARMKFRQLDPDGFDTLMFPDRTVRVPAGWDAYRDRLVEQFPNDRAGIERALDVLRTVAEEGRALPGQDRPTYDLWASRPLSELFNECELSQEAIAVLDHWVGALRELAETDCRLHARDDHQPLHERGLLPRRWWPDDSGSPDRSDRGVRWRGAHTFRRGSCDRRGWPGCGRHAGVR